MKTRILLALALILVLVVAGSAPVAAGGATVPFHADMRTSCVELGFDPENGILTLDCSGEGQATHLGMSTLESITDVYVYEPLPYPQMGDVALIAANGDRLNLYIEGTVEPGAGEGSWEVVDGTGRLAGMTGSGVYWDAWDGEAFHLYFDGTLTKPE